MAESITLSPDSYTVLFLHACKYPHRSVNGLLLGSVSGGSVSVSEALPLFHSPLGLAPMLEAALLLADEYCQQRKLQLVGYYQANEVADDLELGPFGKKICDKIRSQCSACAALLVDGAKMRPAPTELGLLAIGADGKRSSATPTLTPDASGCIARLEKCLGKGLQQEVVDFDVHLDDCSKDWTGNAALVKAQ
jgi:hypothetical protein